MMEATLSFNEDELRLVQYALKYCSNIEVPADLMNAVETELEKLEMVDMSDWGECESCKL